MFYISFNFCNTSIYLMILTLSYILQIIPTFIASLEAKINSSPNHKYIHWTAFIKLYETSANKVTLNFMKKV